MTVAAQLATLATGGVEWTAVLVALIAGAPAILAAVFAYLARKEVKTGNGTTLAKVVQEAHDNSADTNAVVHQIADDSAVAKP